MKKKDMLSALGKTVKDEEVAVKTKKGRLQNRFYKAKEVLDEDKILVQEHEVKKDNIMMISGF